MVAIPEELLWEQSIYNMNIVLRFSNYFVSGGI